MICDGSCFVVRRKVPTLSLSGLERTPLQSKTFPTTAGLRRARISAEWPLMWAAQVEATSRRKSHSMPKHNTARADETVVL